MLMKVFRISFLFCVAHLVMLYSLALASFQFPLDPYITESYFFGQPVGNEYHAGQDCDGTGGTPVYAISDGSISYSGTMGGYGWLITVDHSSDNVYSLYGHVSSRRWKKTSGTVNKGDLIGYLADNDEDGGNWGPHLHFGIRKGKRSDYPSSGYNRWMAGYTDKDPTLYNWYNPTNFIKDRVSKPDLAVSKLTINKIGSSPTQSLTLTPNEQFRIDAYIKNKGNGDVSKEFKIRYLRSSDKKFSSSDTNIGSDSISSLKAGDTKREDIIVNAPPTPGTYYIGAWADSGKVIDESDENNNFSDSDDEIGTIIVQETPPPPPPPQNNIPAIMMIINNLLLDDEGNPIIQISPVSLDFGNINVGNASTAQSITVRNIGNANLIIGTLFLSGANASEFRTQNDACSGKTLAANAACSVDILLMPASSGLKNGYLNIPSNDSNASNLEITLIGSGYISTPLRPSSLTAKPISSTSIVLNWTDNSDNENGFRLQRRLGDCSSTNTNLWANIATKGANITTHTNSGLSPDATYSYRIRAYNSTGNSAWSNCATATTAKSGTPNAPSNLNATSAASSTINLTWKDNSTDETSFKIWRKAGANAWVLLTTINTPNTTYSDTTATGNAGTTTYSYYVRACNSSGCSSATNIAVVPYKPASLKATAGTGKIDLTWTDKSNNETGFQIQRGTCGQAGTWSIIHTTGANVTSYSNAGLTSGNTYSYRVRSFTRSAALPSAMGYSMWSNCVSGTVP